VEGEGKGREEKGVWAEEESTVAVGDTIGAGKALGRGVRGRGEDRVVRRDRDVSEDAIRGERGVREDRGVRDRERGVRGKGAGEEVVRARGFAWGDKDEFKETLIRV